VPIRYMGTKRHMASRVKEAVAGVEPRGPVVDLFSGVGSVAESLYGVANVIVNDAMSFTSLLARTRFTGNERSTTARGAMAVLASSYTCRLLELREEHGSRLKVEQRALELGNTVLADYMIESPHVGNSASLANHVFKVSQLESRERYCLTSSYFAAGYVSLRQAVQIDALRYAIDQISETEQREWMLAAWIAAVASVVNAPGHTAQYLKPNSQEASARIRRYWQKDIARGMEEQLIRIRPVGSQVWRDGNAVGTDDALHLLANLSRGQIGAVYADPPYTKDQYSRFYHLYETLYLYDFPASTGAGRVRGDRFTSSFCLKTGVEQSFRSLFEGVARLQVPLILSYPRASLLTSLGLDIPGMCLDNGFRVTRTEEVGRQHSTLGASNGSASKTAQEMIYVCERR
jgi:adenine-specific DNA-methyltransferase